MAASSLENDSPLLSLHDFYEPLVILKILGPCIGPRTHGTFRTDDATEVPQTELRRFLDRLCWMCDYQAGGESVNAIALQQEESGVIFWLAASYKSIGPCQTCLERILELLQGADKLSAQETDDLEQQISNMCIDNARDKVKMYTKLLVQFTERCRDALGVSDPRLGQDLLNLANRESSSIGLCQAADEFRDKESLRRLSRRIPGSPIPSIWSLLRHYIGRLGSWHRASRTLVEYARKRPELFHATTVKALPTRKPLPALRLDRSISLDSALSRMYAPEEHEQLRRGVETFRGPHGPDLHSKFREDYHDKNFKPRVHAEAWLLEHFHENSLMFLDNDRYIGCSKPSCYCCNLYFLNHPGEFAQRPSHGNVWTNWQSPLHQDNERQSQDASIKSAMIRHFKRDLKSQIVSPRNNYGRLADTTTGFTLSNA